MSVTQVYREGGAGKTAGDRQSSSDSGFWQVAEAEDLEEPCK